MKLKDLVSYSYFVTADAARKNLIIRLSLGADEAPFEVELKPRKATFVTAILATIDHSKVFASSIAALTYLLSTFLSFFEHLPLWWSHRLAI